MGGATEAGQLLLPGSDALRYFETGQVCARIPLFIGYLALLKDRQLPRLLGPTKLVEVADHTMVAIRGEDHTPEGPSAMYGFVLGPDSNEFVEIRRIAGRASCVLSWMDTQARTL